MKIGFFEVERKWERDYLKERLKRHRLKFFEGELNERNVKKVRGVEVLSVFVYSEITKGILDKLPRLKLICSRSTGVDHIDMEECKRRGIVVKSVPYYGENTVAEHTFGLILTLSRKLVRCYESAKRGDFENEDLMGFDLKGKTIAVIGVGHIGEHVVRIARGFGMKVLGVARHPDKKLAGRLGFKYCSLERALRRSDIVSLHVPLTPGTEHMINKKNVNLIKKGALLINTSRGGVVETEAVLKGLKNGRLRGVGLDVLEEESAIREEMELLSSKFSKQCDLRTVIENHVLLNHPKVIITPHNAFNTKEALIRIMDATLGHIKNFRK